MPINTLKKGLKMMMLKLGNLFTQRETAFTSTENDMEGLITMPIQKIQVFVDIILTAISHRHLVHR